MNAESLVFPAGCHATTAFLLTISGIINSKDHAIPWQSHERANHRCAGFEDDPAIHVPRRIAEGARGLVQPF